MAVSGKVRDRHVSVESRPLRIGTRVSGRAGLLQPVLTEFECRSSPDSATLFCRFPPSSALPRVLFPLTQNIIKNILPTQMLSRLAFGQSRPLLSTLSFPLHPQPYPPFFFTVFFFFIFFLFFFSFKFVWRFHNINKHHVWFEFKLPPKALL